MKKNDGGPAFPTPYLQRDGDVFTTEYEHGMTLRDWLAGMALQGHLSNPKTTEHPSYDRQSLVKECYAMADAVLAERDKD